MMFTFEQINYQEIRRLVFVSTKIIVGFLILMYFGASLVFCNDDIPFCKKRLTALKDDVKDWQEKCVNDKVQDIDTTHAVKQRKNTTRRE